MGFQTLCRCFTRRFGSGVRRAGDRRVDVASLPVAIAAGDGKSKLALYDNERLAERTRVARDLHDTLLQSLAGVSLQLDGISKQDRKSTRLNSSHEWISYA